MSGQPYRYATDIARFRSEYMDNLNLQAGIDEMNLKANQVYKATGQLPPQSSMPDTRTTAEKLADTTRLKVSLISELKPIAGAPFAQMVIQEIENSPLNSNGALFIYFAQNVKELVKELTKKYAIGIKGDTNDAIQLKFFIENMYNETKSYTGSVRSSFLRPYAHQRGINLADVDEMNRAFTDVSNKVVAKFGRDRESNRIIKSIQVVISDIRQIVGTKEQLNRRIEAFREQSTEIMRDDTVNNRRYLRMYNDIEQFLESMPLIATVYSAYEHVKKYIDNENPAQMIDALTRLRSLFPDTNTIERLVLDDRDEGYPDIDFEVAGAQPEEIGHRGPVSDFLGLPPALQAEYDELFGPEGGKGQLQSDDQFFKSTGVNTSGNLGAVGSQQSDAPIQPQQTQPQQQQEPTTVGEWMDLAEQEATAQDEDPQDEYVLIRLLYAYQAQYRREGAQEPQALLDLIDSFEVSIRNREQAQAPQQAGGGDQIEGNGIKRKPGRPRGRGIAKPFVDKVDTSKGIQPDRRYVSFGKYFINTNKLHDNIFSIRTAKGTPVQQYPSQRLSPALTSVIKKIVGNGVPSFNELNELNNDEKNYLYSVSKKSDIVDKLSIPTPSKDQKDKDIHDFEVMKGEIMSGNDNKDLIKKFKLHLMKMSRSGHLPKREVNEILSDLVELGF